MKTHKFARKTFYVDAVRVTAENMSEVAEWCGGEILTDEIDGSELNENEKELAESPAQYVKVKVHRPMNDRQTRAYIGDWVLWAGSGFKAYTPKAFDKSFEKVRTLTKSQADAAGIKVPHEPRPKGEQKKPEPKKGPAKKRGPRPGPPRGSNPVLTKEQADRLNGAEVVEVVEAPNPETGVHPVEVKEIPDDAVVTSTGKAIVDGEVVAETEVKDKVDEFFDSVAPEKG